MNDSIEKLKQEHLLIEKSIKKEEDTVNKKLKKAQELIDKERLNNLQKDAKRLKNKILELEKEEKQKLEEFVFLAFNVFIAKHVIEKFDKLYSSFGGVMPVNLRDRLNNFNFFKKLDLISKDCDCIAEYKNGAPVLYITEDYNNGYFDEFHIMINIQSNKTYVTKRGETTNYDLFDFISIDFDELFDELIKTDEN